jgi:hypothetical protein
MITKTLYKTAQAPNKLWYAMAYVKGYWVPVSHGYANRIDAGRYAMRQRYADQDAINCIKSIK